MSKLKILPALGLIAALLAGAGSANAAYEAPLAHNGPLAIGASQPSLQIAWFQRRPPPAACTCVRG